MTHEIANLLAAQRFAVVGASRDPQKYGALVYRTVQVAGKTAYTTGTPVVHGGPCIMVALRTWRFSTQ